MGWTWRGAEAKRAAVKAVLVQNERVCSENVGLDHGQAIQTR